MLEPWLIATLAGRVLLLIAAAMTIGGLFFRWFLARHYGRYCIAGCLVGCFVSAGYLFVRAGDFQREGLAGMFEPGVLSMLWDVQLGYFCVLWFLAFFTLLAGLLAENHLQKRHKITLFTIACSLLIYSAGLVGHTTGLQYGQLLIGLHVFAALWWAGCLLPLAWYCSQATKDVKRVMIAFGRCAMVVCLVLVVCGILLTVQLIPSLTHLWSTGFGLMLLAKLTLVIAAFGLAARHKLKLVPQLEQAGTSQLKKSIYIEALIILCVLIGSVILSQTMTP